MEGDKTPFSNFILSWAHCHKGCRLIWSINGVWYESNFRIWKPRGKSLIHSKLISYLCLSFFLLSIFFKMKQMLLKINKWSTSCKNRNLKIKLLTSHGKLDENLLRFSCNKKIINILVCKKLKWKDATLKS